MKSIKYIGIFAFTALMGLCSCSTDKLSNDSTVSQSKGHKVSLTIGSGAKTRAAEPTDLGGFAREKAIDGDKLYAVVFDQQGKFFEAIKITDYNSGDNTCSFTLSEAGVFYGYIVANTSIDLTSASLTKGSSDEDALYNLIEDTDPGTALAASTNFMMTSKRTLFDVDGDADTNLGSVSLIRSAARIDIDATEIDGLEVTKVVVENRYKKSLLVRGNNPDDTSLGAATPTDTKTYTRGTSAGEVDALNDGTGLVNDRQWQGVIYGYENINTNTVVKITHTLNGVASTTTLDFSTINGGQAIKRNNIYTVKLTNEVLSPTLHNIVASITVEDWDNSVNLAYTDLTDHEKPDYIVTSGHIASEFTSSNLNPNKILANRDDSPTQITLKITSHGKVASEVSFMNKSGVAYDFLGVDGASIEPVGETEFVDGNIVQNYKITIPQTIITSMEGSDYLTFKVHNVFDDTAVGSREFKVRSFDVRWNPLWYVAKSNVVSYNTTNRTVTLEPDPKVKGSAQCFNWSTAMTYFANNHTATQYDGYKSSDVIDSENSGFTYHLPTLQEGLSILPFVNRYSASYGGSEEYNINPYNDGVFIENAHSLEVATEYKCTFGYNGATKVPTSYTSYYDELLPYDLTTRSFKRYAIRFLGENYCSVWKYEMHYDYFIISSKLIGRVEKTASTSELAQIISQVKIDEVNDENYWIDNEEAGVVQRYFYNVGYRYSTSSNPSEGNGAANSSSTKDTYNPEFSRTDFWCTTQASTEIGVWTFYTPTYYDGYVDQTVAKTSHTRFSPQAIYWGFPVRLFREKSE